jgi:hypothetical protein
LGKEVKKGNKTYFSKVFERYVDKFIKKYEKQPKIGEYLQTRLLDLQYSMTDAITECLNDLDARLRKLEQKNKHRAC